MSLTWHDLAERVRYAAIASMLDGPDEPDGGHAYQRACRGALNELVSDLRQGRCRGNGWPKNAINHDCIEKDQAWWALARVDPVGGRFGPGRFELQASGPAGLVLVDLVISDPLGEGRVLIDPDTGEEVLLFDADALAHHSAMGGRADNRPKGPPAAKPLRLTAADLEPHYRVRYREMHGCDPSQGERPLRAADERVVEDLIHAHFPPGSKMPREQFRLLMEKLWKGQPTAKGGRPSIRKTRADNPRQKPMP